MSVVNPPDAVTGSQSHFNSMLVCGSNNIFTQFSQYCTVGRIPIGFLYGSGSSVSPQCGSNPDPGSQFTVDLCESGSWSWSGLLLHKKLSVYLGTCLQPLLLRTVQDSTGISVNVFRLKWLLQGLWRGFPISKRISRRKHKVPMGCNIAILHDHSKLYVQQFWDPSAQMQEVTGSIL